MTRRRGFLVALTAAALAPAACSRGGEGYTDRGYVDDPDLYWDYDLRYGVYAHHYDYYDDRRDEARDRLESRPDRPRPPPGVGSGRPTHLPAGGAGMRGGRGGRR